MKEQIRDRDIEKYLNYLPNKDNLIGRKFFQVRNFEGLLELVSSRIRITLKHLEIDPNNKDFADINIEALRFLESMLIIYNRNLYLDEELEEEFEEVYD